MDGDRRGPGFALVAPVAWDVGGPALSDLDRCSSTSGARGVTEMADSPWYPLKSGIGLDHSVRTVDQCLSVAASDVCAGLSLLDARVVAGDGDLGALVVDGARRQWRHQIASRFDEVIAAAAARRQRAGVVAHLTEPDLKNGTGGLRDVQLVAALTLAHLCDGRSPRAGDLEAAHELVLNARTELHRISGRAREVLHAQYGDEVGDALGVGDRFALARVLGDAARTIAFTTDQAIRDSCSALSTRGLTGVMRRSPGASTARRRGGGAAGRVAGQDRAGRGRPLAGGACRRGRGRTGLPIASATRGARGAVPPAGGHGLPPR